ncbi:MAG: heavy-metal-associated domain-containing protein [Prevotellaceae bacterium]|jgi:copper ion binding protein|nr:heavy-metal-associated domain-containing protein [Prevotellaceae bacterium]
MKKRQIFLICLLLTFFVGSVGAKDNVLKLRVENMTCGGCSGKINKTVSAIDGVSGFEANLEARIVTIAYDDQKTNSDKLKESIQAVKYNAQDYDPNEVITRTVSFKATQIGCGGCVAKVKKNIGAEAGVLSVDGDATTKEVKVQYDANKVSAKEIKQDFQKFSYTVTRYWASEKINYTILKLEELSSVEDVEKTLAATKGIQDFSVNPTTKTIAVAYNNTVFADNALLSASLTEQNLKFAAAK